MILLSQQPTFTWYTKFNKSWNANCSHKQNFECFPLSRVWVSEYLEFYVSFKVLYWRLWGYKKVLSCFYSVHRGTVWEYLLEKWCRGVEYGKLSPCHPQTRIHCLPNQIVRVLGVIHKWNFKKAVKLVKNVMVWLGMVRLHHRHVSGWFLT